MGRMLALIACLFAATMIAWIGEQPPNAAPSDAPRQAFSAARAFPDVQVIARAPHPAGSAANAAVRDHLLRRMTELALTPRLRLDDVFTVHGSTVVGGRAESLIGVLPGRDRALPAVAVMAHYDSETASPGAADDAAGVAAALEVVRALKAGPPPLRDVAVILTDGEEVNLLGARGVFAGDPLAKRIGFIINLEARGGGGRARMFETSPANGETVALFARAVVAPSASSLAVTLYQLMPNDTDFSLARAAGVPGLNFAFIGGQIDYHTASATPANLDRGSLQDLGDQALAVVSAAAGAPRLPLPAPDWAFHQLPAGGPLVGYPAAWGWGLIAVAALLLAIGGLGARRAGAISSPDVLRGIGAGLFILTADAAVLRAARTASGAGFGLLEQHRLLAQSPSFETALILLSLGLLLYTAAEAARGRRGVVLVPIAAGVAGWACGGFDTVGAGLAAAAGLLALASFRRPARLSGAWLGVLLILLAAATLLQAVAAPAAPAAAWPLLLASALGAVSALGAWRTWPARVVIMLGVTLGLAWLGGIVHGVYLGLDQPELLAVPVLLAAGVIWPLAHPEKSTAGTPFVAVMVLLAGVALLIHVRVDDPWSPRHPLATRVVYHQNLATGQAWRLNAAPEPSAWARAVLTADGGTLTRRTAPLVFDRPVDAARARPIAAAAPSLTLARRADGEIVLTAAPPPGAASLILEIASSQPLAAVTLNGRATAILDHPGQPVRIRWRPATGGLTLGFHALAPGALDIRFAGAIPAWPADARPLPPRPAEVMAFGISDSTLVTGTTRLTW